MNRRLPHSRPTPTLTKGDDLPQPACAGNSTPYDLLIDLVSGAQHRAAAKEARDVCGACPLMAACFRTNENERWVRAILGVRAPTIARPTCGTSAGAHAHSKADEEACDPCKAAWRQVYHDRKQRRAAA